MALFMTNEDAFSSSSEEASEEDNDVVNSEWDRALKSGKPSTGHVAAFKSNDSNAESPQRPAHSSNNTVISVHSTVNVNPNVDEASVNTGTGSSVSHNNHASRARQFVPRETNEEDSNLSGGVLPDVLMTMRLRIESLQLFDSDMMKLTDEEAVRESLKRSSQQSISAAVLVSLAHKRYERRRLAAMEIEKVTRSLLYQQEMERIRAILLLLSDDYVRSTSEDARKGGVVALAACAIALKRARDDEPLVQECRDLILASVLHACQDHSSRVRYYATESLFNVVKVIPTMAVQHFFILFEILRSLYADVDADVRSGAELLDKKLKEVIVSAMNAGTFTAEACVPVFARFVYMRNKATKRLTLTWLQELNEKLLASPILEFLHLFLGGIFDMVADPTVAIRESAILFLHSVLPKLLVVDQPFEGDQRVDFDKILQSLVTTMEHPDPFVRKVAMYWMSRIVKAHCEPPEDELVEPQHLSVASISVRNSLPHILPGILLSIGDDYQPKGNSKDSFLPDQTTRALAEQTNATLQAAVRRDGPDYVPYLDGFIVALREELDSPGSNASGTNRYPLPIERTPYRMDVKQDGTGIESPGWFSSDGERDSSSTVMSRLCALDWVIVLYESVVPIMLKADYAREFVYAIIHQLVDNPPESIVYKSLEVLAKITVPVAGENGQRVVTSSFSGITSPAWLGEETLSTSEFSPQFPMTETNISFAFDILEPSRRVMMSRNREVFSALIHLHSYNTALLTDLSNVITYMCKLQPPEFVFVSFAVELDRYIARKKTTQTTSAFARDLRFVSSFVQNLNHVLLNKPEAKEIRDVLQDCVCCQTVSERDRQRSRLFHILLHGAFAHNLAATISLCFWAGAYRTTNLFLNSIDPLDINLMFLLEIDRFIELLERPLFRHLHVRMLEHDKDPNHEGSGSMLFKALKSLLLMLPQSTCYLVLKDRLVSVSRFRQSTIRTLPSQLANSSVTANNNGIGGGGDDSSRSSTPNAIPPKTAVGHNSTSNSNGDVEVFLSRVLEVRDLHCEAAWNAIRSESLEIPILTAKEEGEPGDNGKKSRREWLGYASEEEEKEAHEKRRQDAINKMVLARKCSSTSCSTDEEELQVYSDLASLVPRGGQDPNCSSITFVETDREEGKEDGDGGAGGSTHHNTEDQQEPEICEDSSSCDNADWKQFWEEPS